MKKLVAIIITACILNGCGKVPNTVDTRQKLTLENNLGEVYFKLPEYYDTSFSWVHTSECGDPCADVKYRYQNKQLPIFKETGFSFAPLKDSVCQLTIVHSKVMKPLAIADSSLPAQYLFAMKKEISAGRATIFVYDTVIKKDGKNFAVIGYEVLDTVNNTMIKVLRSATAIKGNMLQFVFERRNKKDDALSPQFLEQSFDVVKNISIKQPEKK